MRYEDWDILLFPTGLDPKVPVKEFKVACNVVPDGEFSHSHGAYGLPVMTCFIPGLPAGTPFHISVHSWRTPGVSQFTRSYSKHIELVKFEARILIDGRIVASTSFDRVGEWPHLINDSFEFTKAGELEPLKFPPFRRELLYQNHWNPGDDIGRIKIILSEGFPRDSLTTPIERVKNVVAFSFQHAPIDILESNGIAWPNPHMWRRPPLTPSLPVPTYHPEEGSTSHGHSPRRRSAKMRAGTNGALQVPLIPGMIPPQSTGLVNPAFGQSVPVLQRGATSLGTCPDHFTESAAYREWLNSLGLSGQLQTSQPETASIWPAFGRMASKYSSTDTTMSDYASTGGTQNMLPEQMHVSGPSLDEDFCSQTLKVPTNTPVAAGIDDAAHCSATPLGFNIPNSAIPGDLAASLTHSLLNQPHPLPILPHQIPLPATEIKSRKENRQPRLAKRDMSPASASPAVDPLETRKFSQSHFGMGGAGGAGIHPSGTCASSNSPSTGPVFSADVSRNNSAGDFGTNITNMTEATILPLNMNSSTDKGVKRTRTFTPASTKAIDDEDEPRRPSPRVRASPFGGDGADEE